MYSLVQIHVIDETCVIHALQLVADSMRSPFSMASWRDSGEQHLTAPQEDQSEENTPVHTDRSSRFAPPACGPGQPACGRTQCENTNTNGSSN